MKRLGMYVIIMLILVSSFIIPQKSFAQTTAATDPSILLNKGVKIFDDEINAVQSQSANDPALVKRLVNSINNVKAIFVDEYNNPKPGLISTPTTPEEKYASAMKDASIDIVNVEAPQYCDAGLARSQTGCQILSNFGLVLGKESNPTPGIFSPDTPQSAQAKLAAVNTISKDDPSSCGFFVGNWINCIDPLFAWIIKNTLLQIAGFLVWISANMLNLSIQVGILGFSQWAPDALYPIWIIVRQIISLFIVFSGLWLGFMYIIGRDDAFKKYIPWVIIFALFVNFSYPLSRALIDVSNVISLNIYTSSVGSDPLTGGDPNNTAGAQIMNRLGLQGLAASATAINTQSKSLTDNINSTPGALMAVIFVAYAAYVFFMATAIIAVRTAVLVFLIIASPILFVDSVIPKLGEEAAKLRKMYFEQLIVAPVFMIMLALTLKFLEVFQTSGALGQNSNTLNTIASGASGSVVTFFNILMMLIMLHIMIKVTKSISGTVGEYATKAMGTVGGFALGGVAGGGAGLLARSTIGRGAAAIRDTDWVKNNQDTFIGRRAYNMTNSLANTTYDVRNVGAVSKGMANAGMGMGQGGKLGYEGELKAKVEDRTVRYGRINTTTQSGAESKQRFFTNAGGVFTNKEEVRKSLLEKDRLEATRENISIRKRGATSNTAQTPKPEETVQPSVNEQASNQAQNQTPVVDNNYNLSTITTESFADKIANKKKTEASKTANKLGSNNDVEDVEFREVPSSTPRLTTNQQPKALPNSGTPNQNNPQDSSTNESEATSA